MGTKRSSGDGSVFKLGDGRWRAQITMPGPGKRRYKTATRATETEAKRALRDMRRLVERGVTPTRDTLGGWLTYWLDEVKAYDPKVRPMTLHRYRRIVDLYIAPAIGDVRLQEMRGEHVRQLHRWMRELPVRSKDGKRVLRVGLSPTTINHAHALLRAALAQAVDERRAEWNPADVVDAPAPSGNHFDQLDRGEIRQVLDHVADTQQLARVLIATVTGMRQSEVLALLWDDVHEDDPEVPHLRVEAALVAMRGIGLVRQPPKTASSRRSVPLPAALREVLRMWRLQSGGRGFVFPGLDAETPMWPARDHRRWKALLKRAGVRAVPLHGARGSLSTMLDQQKTAGRVGADIFGHAQVVTREEHYSRSDLAERMRALEAVAAGLVRVVEPSAHG